MSVPEIGAVELAEALAGSNPPRLLDVRESFELGISALDGLTHIPMAEIPYRYQELDPSSDWVVVCRSGNRSASVTAFLLAQGFAKVRNFKGGMNSWSALVDSTVRRY